MDTPTPEPEKPRIPPPDIPKSNIPIPPPDIPPVSAPPPRSGVPVVKVKIRQPGDPAEPDENEAKHVPFNTRMVAALIDWVLALGIFLAATWFLPGFVESLAWLFGAAYLVTRDSLPFLGGQSVGKKAMHIRAVALDDKPLVGDWQTALIRNGVLLIPFFGLIEIFILLSREEGAERGKRLGDEWARTKVVNVPRLPDEDKDAST